MIAKIVACFSGLSAAESGWLLGRVIFHAADVNNFGVSSTRLSSLKGKGNFIIICSGTALSVWPLCAQWLQHTHKVKQTNNKMASPADATSNNNSTEHGLLLVASLSCWSSENFNRVDVNMNVVYVSSTTWLLFSGIVVVVRAAALIKFLNNFSPYRCVCCLFLAESSLTGCMTMCTQIKIA